MEPVRNLFEPRSIASQAYRLFCTRSVRLVAASFVIAGWALALFGSTAAVPADSSSHIEFVIWLGGGMLVFVGCTAGFVSWVLNPAIDRRFAQHNRTGAEEHKDLLDRVTYDRRHEQIVDKLNALSNVLSVLTGQLSVRQAHDSSPNKRTDLK